MRNKKGQFISPKKQVVANSFSPMTMTNYRGVKKHLADRPEWDDLLINSGLFKFAGSSDPTWRTWTIDCVDFQALSFDDEDEIFFTCQLPHTYKEGTDIRAHVHWTPKARGNEEINKYVGWKLDVSWANINGDPFTSVATIDMTDKCSGTDDYHEVSAGSTNIDGTGKKISSMLVCRLYRDDSEVIEYWEGTGVNAPALLQFDFHHEVNSMGSSIEWVK